MLREEYVDGVRGLAAMPGGIVRIVRIVVLSARGNIHRGKVGALPGVFRVAGRLQRDAAAEEVVEHAASRRGGRGIEELRRVLIGPAELGGVGLEVD